MFYKKAYVKHVTPGQAIFGPRDIICTNLVEVTLVMLIPNIKAIGLLVSVKKIFSWFSPYKPM